MDFTLPADDDPRRLTVRAWLDEHPEPSNRQLAEFGYVAPGWPPPWGLGADPITEMVIDEELARAGVVMPDGQIGVGWAGPTIIAGGTEEQKQRYLVPMLAAEEYWCQLFSEPEAGSDLASLRTSAMRDGDVYVVNGQKIWSSYADWSQFGILLARTDVEAPKHKGISYFICPMELPGIEVRPLREMTGNHHFNEVFFTDVRIPADNLVGQENGGWALAKLTLSNERTSLSSGGVLWSMGPTADEFLDRVRSKGGMADAGLRQRAAEVYIEKEVLRLLGYRVLSGLNPSLKKLLADHHGQHVMGLAKDMTGAWGMVDGGSEWDWGFLFSPALTIGGGTSQVLRGILAEQLLGLPREPA